MRLMLDHEELNNVINVVDDDTFYINDQLDALLYQLEELKKVWLGRDADEFFDNAEAYIRYLKRVPQYINNVSMVMSGANKYYYQTDKHYAQRMKRAVEPDE